jgi:hypothetical protein
MARCPNCNSIWVCWNWIHVPVEKLQKMNPNIPVERLKKGQWTHECWNCGDDISGFCFETENKVTNGIPYWILRRFSKWFIKDKGSD